MSTSGATAQQAVRQGEVFVAETDGVFFTLDQARQLQSEAMELYLLRERTRWQDSVNNQLRFRLGVAAADAALADSIIALQNERGESFWSKLQRNALWTTIGFATCEAIKDNE